MSDNLFSAVLTFSLLAAGTAAVGAEMMGTRPTAKATAVCSLPPVTVIGKRIAAVDSVTLPTVVVTGRRQAGTEVAIGDTGRESRVQ